MSVKYNLKNVAMYNKNNTITKRTLLVIGTIISVVILASCEDRLLNKAPRAERNEATFFDNEQDAIQATNATYSQLVKFDRSPQPFWSSVNHIWYLGLTDIASDDANEGTEPTDGPDVRLIDNVDYRAGEGPFEGIWQWKYRIIYRANNAIQNIPDIEMDEGLKQRLIAENKFIRAHAYFWLVNAWGGVPLLDRPLEPGEFEQPKATVEEVYDLIEQDLRDGVEALPAVSEYPSSEVGRASKGAAQGYLAKVLLFREKYDEAQELVEDVISSGEYHLLQDYDQIFTPEGENTSESLFEIQAEAYSDMSGGTTFSNPQGVRAVEPPNLGWGFNSPERDLLNDYEPGDQRLQSTVLFVFENLPYGPHDVVKDHPRMIDERYNQKAFIPKENPGSIPNMNGGNNIRILRYSDVLLVGAEAAYHNNNTGLAQDLLNEVRQRARNGRQSTIGIIPETFSDLIADTVGMPELEDKPFIRWINPGGPAEGELEAFEWEVVEGNSKIVVNTVDIIDAVNGNTVSNVEEYNDAMRSISKGQSINIDIIRITETFDDGNKTTNTEDLQFTITTEEVLPDITASGQDLLDAIWHERRVELAMEQHRMWDIRRQGRAGELLRAQGKPFEDGVNELYPIPRNETQLNPALEQNPGYN